MQRILIESSYAVVWRDLLNGITRFVREKHARWELHCVSSEEFLAGMARKPDGALCLMQREQKAALRAVRAARVPAVNMLRDVAGVLPCVTSDHEAIGAEAAEYFLSRGFRRFAFLGPDRDWSRARAKGFAERLAARGQADVVLHERLDVQRLRVSDRRTSRALQAWVAGLGKPVGIFAAADFVARVLLQGCAAARRRVPEDVAILGVDNDVEICELASIPLSSIPQNLEAIGFEAARLLDGLMRGRRSTAGALLIAPKEIVVRRSTDIVAFEDRHVNEAMKQIHGLAPNAVHLKQIVRKAGVSRQWLDRRFRAVVGRTMSEEIARRRLQYARVMLLETALTIREIALRAGFSNAENLTRFFRKRIGMTPTAMRAGGRRRD